MITLIYPRADETNYLVRSGMLIGPFGSDFTFRGDPIPGLPNLGLWFHETPGPFHENGILHSVLSGDITYLRHSEVTSPVPTSVYPDAVSVPSGTTGFQTYNYGIHHGFGDGRQKTSATQTGHTIFWGRFTDGWVFLTISMHASNPHRVILVQREAVMPKQWIGTTSVSTSKNLQTYFFATGLEFGDIDFTSKLTEMQATEIWSAFVQKFGVTPGTNSTVSFQVTKVRYKSALVPANVFELVVPLIDGILTAHSLDSETPYGDLVMKATEKVNATKINLLAFLRDLREPQKLIPKLKNLSSLKVLAGNYLSVSYGILPTISDLRNIWDAVSHVRSSLDRNGYHTYYASSSHQSNIDFDVSVNVTRRVKIAIGNEDSLFLGLCEAAERIGAFPSLKNIWDLVPYSFVLDWFADVGNLLERVDTHLRVLRLNIIYTTVSRKEEVCKTFSPTALNPISGKLTWVQYHRWVSDQCPVPPLSLQTISGGFDHWVEGAALLVQRL